MSLPQPHLVAGRRAVRAALADLPPGAPVVVGCSGGPDSLALAACVAHERVADGREVRVVVVDHGLQDGSDEVARRAAGACAALGLDAHVVRVDVGLGGGPEAAARDARHAALEAALDALDDRADGAVLLGHTLDDQAEGVLLGLARGSGARSLAGMRPVRGRVRRPFLALGRGTTLGICAELGLEPWHDPTNTPAPGDAAAPRRSRVRHEVLPVLADVLGPGVVRALARSAELAREDDDALGAWADDLARRARAAAASAVGAPAVGASGAERSDDVPDGDGGLDAATLADAPAAVRRRALRAWAVTLGAADGALARTHVLALDALVVAWRGQGPVQLPGGPVVRRTCGRLVGHRPAP